MNNQTQLVRSAINFFIVAAVGISLLQELINTNQKQNIQPNPLNQAPLLQPTGPKISGVRIQASDKFQTPIKQILAKQNLNIEIVPYDFVGNQNLMNLIANWGHILLIFIFMRKYSTETNDATKKKIMIVGALAVIGWFYFSPQLKPQKYAIEVNGYKIVEKNNLLSQELLDTLSEYEFEIDDMNESKTIKSADSEPGETIKKLQKQHHLDLDQNFLDQDQF